MKTIPPETLTGTLLVAGLLAAGTIESMGQGVMLKRTPPTQPSSTRILTTNMVAETNITLTPVKGGPPITNINIKMTEKVSRITQRPAPKEGEPKKEEKKGEEGKKDEAKKEEKPKEPELSPVNTVVQLNAGVMMLSPYKIADATNSSGRKIKRLDKGDSQAHFYIDIAANYVWSWNVERRYQWAVDAQTTPDSKIKKLWSPAASKTDDGGVFGIGPLDFQGHINFIARGKDKTTASAIIGSGEFGTEATIGIPFYQALYTTDGSLKAKDALELYDKTTSTHWLGLVLSYVGVTDSDAFDIHSRYLAGLGYRAAFKAPWQLEDTPRPREVVLSFTGGYASVETVEFANGSDREIKFERDGVPKYEKKSSFAVEAEVYFPVNKTANVVVGTRLYNGINPNSWNAYAALTIPFSSLAKIFE